MADRTALDALNASLSSASIDEFLAHLAPGAVVWHNDDKVEMDAAENMKRVPALQQLLEGVAVDVVQVEPLEHGWLQRFVLRGTVRSSGRPFAAHNCIVMHVGDDGRVTRIDEYVDPTFGTQLGLT
ncbi:MAG TPA: hypothetical protein VFC99_14840 [Acidimicrobiia bacterium]|nr:hypothetical protein [Acidimicrobiia bacterium]